MRFLIAGCGYVGTALGADLVKSGHEVWGVRRSVDASRMLESSGIRPMIGDLSRLEDVPEVDVIVLCQAPSRKNDEYKTVYFDATQNFLNLVQSRPAAKSIRKIILVSSTSVYGVSDGSWVDESMDPLAFSHADAEANENAKIMLSQEQLVLNSGFPALVFRLSGIYGPSRNRVQPILEGKIKPSFSNIYMNRIHVADIVKGARILLDKGNPGQVYLGADDHPSTQNEFYTWLFEELSLPVPPNSAEVLVHGPNKRVSNKKIKALGIKFRYPNYKEGYLPLIKEILARSKPNKSTSSSNGSWIS